MVMAPTTVRVLPSHSPLPGVPWQLKLVAAGLVALVATPLVVAFDALDRLITAHRR